MKPLSMVLAGACVLIAVTAWCRAADEPKRDDGFVPLFAGDGVPQGWRVTLWSDVSKRPPPGAAWRVEKNVLHGSTPRGSWLVSERQYGDFTLDFEFKLGPQGNSGVGLRIPDAGDPAFDALEIQIVDARYYDGTGNADQLTGSLYGALPPAKQVYKPEEWNRYEITCRGPQVTVKLNGETIQDVNLDEQTKKLERGSPLAQRPRRGHVGFQELGRRGSHVQIRGARIKELDK
jgi:hypothetical protein